MGVLPAPMLSRLYESNSLRNTAGGFELSFKNRLAPTTLTGVGPLTIGRNVYDANRLVICLERPAVRHGRVPEPLERPAEAVAADRILPFGLNVVARIVVNGDNLPPGEYDLTFSFRTREVGEITVKARDRVE